MNRAALKLVSLGFFLLALECVFLRWASWRPASKLGMNFMEWLFSALAVLSGLASAWFLVRIMRTKPDSSAIPNQSLETASQNAAAALPKGPNSPSTD
jgi:hypothetical protein